MVKESVVSSEDYERMFDQKLCLTHHFTIVVIDVFEVHKIRGLRDLEDQNF